MHIVELLLNLLLYFLIELPNYQALKQTLLSILLLLPLYVGAQINNNFIDRHELDHHEFGLTLGIANYYGDLQPKLFPKYGYMPMVGIVYKYFMTPHLGFRFGASFCRLTAADSMSDIAINKARNLSFTTNLFEIHGGLELNLWPIDIMRNKFTPYLFGGISAFYFNPFAQDTNGNKVFLRPLSTEGQGLPMYPDRKEYSLVNIAFPFGAGVKFFIGKAFFLTAELGFRYTNTDYLDDVSKSYVNLDTLAAYKGQLAKRMSYRGYSLSNQVDPNDPSNHNYHYPNPDYGFQRGDTKSNDWYWFGNITCTIYFKAFGGFREYKKMRCPGFFSHYW